MRNLRYRTVGRRRDITAVKVATLSLPAYSHLPFVFAFKETRGRPEVSRRGEKRGHRVFARAGGGVVWHPNTKTGTQAK